MHIYAGTSTNQPSPLESPVKTTTLCVARGVKISAEIKNNSEVKCFWTVGDRSRSCKKMALGLLMILVLGLQGCCSAVKNETRLSIQESTQVKSTNVTNSTVIHATIDDHRTHLGAATSPVLSTTSKYLTSLSNSSNGIEHTTSASQATTILIPKTIATTEKSNIFTTAQERRNLPVLTSKPTGHKDNKVKLTISGPTTPSTNLNTQKFLVSSTTIRTTKENSSDEEKNEPRLISLKTELEDNNGTKGIQTPTNLSKDNTKSEETPEETAVSTTTTEENEFEQVTLTPAETATEEEISTTSSTEPEDWSYLETSESATGSAEGHDLFYGTTEFPGDFTTMDPATEQETEDTITKRPSIPNGIALHESLPIRGVPSPLTKLIFRLSKPGVFEKGKSVFEDDSSTMTTSCPPGDIGLPCRRAEARRTADECSGGNCEVCRSCNNMAATDWPHCCRENFRCCSELALACQQCDQPTLQVFCTKHFKRCF